VTLSEARAAHGGGRLEDGEVGGLAGAAASADRTVEALVEAFGEVVFRYCRRMLGDDADADDAAQTVFLQAFEARNSLERVENVRGWLLGIARHRCLDRLRARRRAPVAADELTFGRALEAIAAEPAELLDPRALRALDDCLDALDHRSRAVVVLRYHDQLPYDEIGRLTGDRAGALRVRVTRALAALRGCLAGKGVTA
jgi:RNA polymerase sigma-70 factor, ECF subfamily